MPLQAGRSRSGRRGLAQQLATGWSLRLDPHALRVAAPKLAIATLVGAALVALMSWGDPPLRYHRGDLVSRDVIARVDFEAHDEEATTKARQAKRKATPSVYRSDTAALATVTQDLARAVALVARAEDLAAYRRQGEKLWRDLSPEEFAALKAVIERKGEETVRAAFEEMLAELGRRGVIDTTQKTVEVGEGRDRIIVQRDSEQQLVPLNDLLSSEALASWVNERATTILGETARAAAEALSTWCSDTVGHTVVLEPGLSDRARKRAATEVPPVTIGYREGQTIIARGAIIDQEKYRLLETEQVAFLASLQDSNPGYRAREVMGRAMLVGLLMAIWAVYFSP